MDAIPSPSPTPPSSLYNFKTRPSEVTSNISFQEKLDRWQIDRLRLHPQLYAKELATAKAGRSEALWREANSEYGATYHPLKRITKGQAADAVRYLDRHYPGWDDELFQLYWTLNINVVHDYFFPAIKVTHPEAVKITLSDQIGFPLTSALGRHQEWSPPVSQPEHGVTRKVVVACLLAALGVAAWLTLDHKEAAWLVSLPSNSIRQESNHDREAATTEKSLTEMRIWTDSNGRTLEASLIKLSKGTDGLYTGIFRRPNDEEFSYHIGLLSKRDIEIVKTLAQKITP